MKHYIAFLPIAYAFKIKKATDTLNCFVTNPSSQVNKFKNKYIVSNCKPGIRDFFIFTGKNHGYPVNKNTVVLEDILLADLLMQGTTFRVLRASATGIYSEYMEIVIQGPIQVILPRFIRSATLNRKKFKRSWMNFVEIANSGELVFEMGKEINKNRALFLNSLQ